MEVGVKIIIIVSWLASLVMVYIIALSHAYKCALQDSTKVFAKIIYDLKRGKKNEH